MWRSGQAEKSLSGQSNRKLGRCMGVPGGLPNVRYSGSPRQKGEAKRIGKKKQVNNIKWDMGKVIRSP